MERDEANDVILEEDGVDLPEIEGDLLPSEEGMDILR